MNLKQQRQRKPFYSIVESSFDVLLAAAVTDLLKAKEDVPQRLLFSPPPAFKKQKLKAKRVMSQLRERGREKKLQISVESLFWKSEGCRSGA